MFLNPSVPKPLTPADLPRQADERLLRGTFYDASVRETRLVWIRAVHEQTPRDGAVRKP